MQKATKVMAGVRGNRVQPILRSKRWFPDKDVNTIKRLVALTWFVFLVARSAAPARGAALDVVPFGRPLPEGNGVMWEDPREIHRVVAHFTGTAPAPERVRLEYWGSRWPEQHLPKDREPGGGDVGWMELGNWYRGGWRVADTETKSEGNTITFS